MKKDLLWNIIITSMIHLSLLLNLCIISDPPEFSVNGFPLISRLLRPKQTLTVSLGVLKNYVTFTLASCVPQE